MRQHNRELFRHVDADTAVNVLGHLLSDRDVLLALDANDATLVFKHHWGESVISVRCERVDREEVTARITASYGRYWAVSNMGGDNAPYSRAD